MGSVIVKRASAHRKSDPLGETVAFRDLRSPVLENENEDYEFPEADELVGETIGQYRLNELVGRGSMGRVYRADHLGLHRACAIKVMNPDLVKHQPQIRERFWAEARAVANLLHPHVVTIHNLGSDRGYHFIEMEYVAGGESLQQRIVREGPIEAIRASHLLRQVVLALGAAHDAGLIHRDVKPANVLLNIAGDAKLADFGLVRRLGELDRAGHSIGGTPTFMAPELFEGVPASHRSDIYAVGVMFYYMLTARLPFASDKISELIPRHRFDPVPDIRKVVADLPDAILPILERCLAKSPSDRYHSAEELASELQSVILQFRNTESLIRESVEGLDCCVSGAFEQFRVLFQLPGDRLQEVYVEGSTGSLGEKLLTIFSVCGPAEPKNFEFALRLNDKLSYGGLSIRDVNSEPMFVMNRTFSRDHIGPADTRAALLEIARRSDRIEQMITNADVY